MSPQGEFSEKGKPESGTDDGMRTVGSRIKYIRTEILRVSQERLAELMAEFSGESLTRGAVGNWELKGGISRQNVTVLSHISGVDVDWILSGRGKVPEKSMTGMEPFKKTRVLRSSADLSEAPRKALTAPTTPILGVVAAGSWVENSPVAPYDSAIDYLPIEVTAPFPREAVYGLSVVGTSLNRVAKNGDVLVCLDVEYSGYQAREEDLVVVRRTSKQDGKHEVTAKRLRRRNGTLVLMPESDDPRWQEPIELTPDGQTDGFDVTVIARVLWIYSKP